MHCLRRVLEKNRPFRFEVPAVRIARNDEVAGALHANPNLSRLWSFMAALHCGVSGSLNIATGGVPYAQV